MKQLAVRIRALGPLPRWGALLLVCIGLLAGSTPVVAQNPAAPAPVDSLPPYRPVEKHFGRAFGEVFAVNLFVWSFNRYIREGGTNPGFRVGFDTWEENIKNGFEWDDNNFATNQFAHPYHGSLYYNAARSNGYSYWESIPFVFAGSFMWEYFGETHHPSINDAYSTAVGGIALGESLYRLSDLVLDNTASGSNRTWRELGGFLINPVRGVNRLITGRTFQKTKNAPGRHPGWMTTTFDIGLRTVGSDRLWDSDTTRGFLEFDFDYGHPFEKPIEKPFDYFDFGIQVNFGDKTSLGRVQSRGALFGADLFESDVSHHVLSAFHHFDYFNNSAFEFGGQSLGGALLSRFEAGESFLHTELHLNWIMMGADKSDYRSITGRDYDYGPGAGFKLRAALNRRGRDFFTFEHDQHWLRIMNGNDGTHLVSLSTIRLDVPVVKTLAVGAEYQLYLSERKYDEFPDVSQRNPQFRLYMSWLMASGQN